MLASLCVACNCVQLWVHSSHFESCLVAVAVPAKAPLVVRGGGTRALLLVGCTQGQGFRGGSGVHSTVSAP